MFDTMSRYIQGLSNVADQPALRPIFLPLVDRYSSQPLNTAGLAISAGGATTAKTGATDFYATAAGVLVKITAGTTLPVLTGLNITAASFNAICFFVDSAGTVTVTMGTEGTTLAGVKWPQFPQGKALVGFLIVTNGSTFTGGTTPLDTATTVYVSPLGPFDPTVLV